jgi:hypothetical protein
MGAAAAGSGGAGGGRGGPEEKLVEIERPEIINLAIAQFGEARVQRFPLESLGERLGCCGCIARS